MHYTLYTMFDTLFEKARKIIAAQNKGMKYTHVAFVFEKGNLLATGWNKTKSHPFLLKYPYSRRSGQLHAELDAIIKYGKDDCGKAVLVVVRLNRRWQPRLSKPCLGCQSMIKQLGFKGVWYSTESGFEKL